MTIKPPHSYFDISIAVKQLALVLSLQASWSNHYSDRRLVLVLLWSSFTAPRGSSSRQLVTRGHSRLCLPRVTLYCRLYGPCLATGV